MTGGLQCKFSDFLFLVMLVVDIIAMAKDSADSTAGLLSDIENLERSISRLMEMLDKVLDYVNRVVVGLDWTRWVRNTRITR